MFWGTGLNKEEVSLYTHHKNWHGNNRVRLLYQNWITNKSRYPEDFLYPEKVRRLRVSRILKSSSEVLGSGAEDEEK